MAAEREFATRRRNALHELYDLDGDRSRKGSVDAPIQDLVDLINAHPHMFTTSSCSGRISCFAEPTPETRAAGLKGGEWVYASHDKADADEVVSKVTAAAAKAGCLVFRMEPFVMHVEARGVEWSALLLGWARQAGFRESGMVPSLKGRCMVGIRCNLRLEVPLADEGNLLVGEAYIRYLVNMANAKFDANADRHARFLEVLRGMPQELEHSAARNGAAGRVKAHPHPPAVEASSAIRPRQGRGRRGRGRGGAGKHASLPPGSAPASGGAGTREQALAERQLALLSRLAAVEERVARAELPGAVLRTEPLLRCLPFRCPTARPTGGERRDARGGHRQQRRRGARASAELTPQELGRWGLSATHLPGLPGKVVVFGGFGGTAAHRRHADVLLADLVEGTLSRPPVDAGLSHPCARCYHAALPIGAHRLLVVGGRVGPSAPLGDAWLLDARSWAWSPLEGAALPPRFRHAAAVTPASKEHPTQQVVVFGGCSGEGELLGDAWLLDASAPWRWQPLQLGGTPPGPRHSAAAAATADGRVFIYGGLASRAPHGLDDLHCLARQPDGAWLSTRVALPAEGPATWPPPAFSATLTALPAPSGGCRLVMLGGCSTLNHTATYVLDTASCAWRKQPLAVHEPRSYAPVRHACCYVPAVPGLCEGSAGLLCVVGGGAVCFAFGTIQGALHCVEVAPFVGGSAGTAVTAPPGKQQRRGRKSGRKENPAVAASEPQGWVLALPKQHAKQMKDALKAARWLDQARRGGELAAGEVGLPLTAAAAEALLGGGDTGVAGRLLELSGGEVRRQAMSAAQRVQSPARRLREAMSSLLSRHGASLPANEHAALLDALPVKWERLGELVLLPAGAFQGAAWAAVPASELWPAVAEALQTRKLARQAPVASTGTRDSQAELLLGADGWATHKEYGVLFSLDATRCMFSSGNVTERGRMGGLDAAGETVVDLFTGIGYYTLPLLARAGAAKVFACEWNPHAVEALRVNLDTNGVAARCEVRQGDCRQVAPTGVADRVLLGLLPSSTCGWPTAVAALKSSGGWLHVHENVKDSEEEEWVAATAAKMEELAAAAGRRWTVYVAHLEHVKWYAPHIRHVVLDLHCCADSGAHLEGAISQPVRPELA